MFKWMISGHRSHQKQKSGKLNNNTNPLNNSKQQTNNKLKSNPDGEPNNNSNEVQQPKLQQSSQQQRFAQLLQRQEMNNGQPEQHLISASRDTLNDSNEYTTLETLQHQNTLQQQRHNSTTNIHRSMEHLNGNLSLPPMLKSEFVDNSVEVPPPLPSSRPPMTIGSQPNLHSCPPNQSLPPLPINGLGNNLPQAPGTCTLPRRSIVREDPTNRYRSPSNPAPNVRPLPPYSRYQPTDSSNNVSPRRLTQPPPPPPRVPENSEKHTLPYKYLPPNAHFHQEPQNLSFNPQSHGSSNQDCSSSKQSFESWRNLSHWREHDSGFESLNSRHADKNSYLNPSSSLPSKSTEDLLNASKVPNSSSILPQQSSQSSILQKEVLMPEVLSSDSMYPQDMESRYDSMPDRLIQNDRRREPFVLTGRSEMVTFRPRDSPTKIIQSSKTVLAETPKVTEVTNKLQEDREDFLARNKNRPWNAVTYGKGNLRPGESRRCEEATGNDKNKRLGGHELFIREDNEVTKDPNSVIHIDDFSYPGGADKLTVKDAPLNSTTRIEDDLEEGRRGDGCASASSSSWMEWTQQLQAYVAWVNSQLRKSPDKSLITDLRRDFQNGVVFADLIEIIAGEKVAGILRDADTPQLCRENLDRVLQFMTAKRIRMTHITSKEITEGNLKSIMRVILALAAHYKPQSVRDGVSSQSNSVPNTPPKPQKKSTVTMHDIGVGPDKPISAPDKTPSLVRKNIAEESGPLLRRQPSLSNNVTRNISPSPVYENIMPNRTSQNRWAYDSLRASHKFYWNGSSSSPVPTRQQIRSKNGLEHNNKSSLDESSATDETMNSTLNTSRCTSLNTSLDGDIDSHRDFSNNQSFNSVNNNRLSRPAALDFWQELQTKEDEEKPKDTTEDNPFRYHTIHRMSGRRKLPQIPGQSSSPSSANNSRGTTPLGVPSGPLSDTLDESIDRSTGGCNSYFSSKLPDNSSDETSREPEGRSQNSSPATSLIRAPLVENWREMFGIEKCLEEELKGSIKELQTSRDKFSGLKQVSAPNNNELNHSNRGVGTLGTADQTYLFDYTTTKDRNSESHSDYDSMTSPDQLDIQDFSRKDSKWRFSARFKTKDKVDAGTNGDSSNLRQEVIRHILARQTIEKEKIELSKHIHDKDNIIADLRKQILQKDKNLHLQRTQFEEALRNIQNGKPYRSIPIENPSGRTQGREELQLVREAVSALRSNFRGTDPNQHTLDTLEQAIAVLMERSFHSSADLFNGTKKEKRSANGVEVFTKIIYFTDRTVTPFMSSINKRIGDVTLQDFKDIFDRPGSYRYHFKSQDPEYGLVKEEIINEDDILPGIEGKIIAWVEEDSD